MLLKQASASVLVDSIRVVLIEILNTVIQARMLQTLVDRVREELDVRVERELVHRIDASHVIHHKEQERGSFRARTVALVVGYVKL